MIDKLQILEIVDDELSKCDDKFVVGLKVTTDNRIFVDIDGDNGISIDDCIALSRAIESRLDRDTEDFELNVSSAGADAPLKMPRQYRRHVGRSLTVVLPDGERIEGTLTEADDTHFVLFTKGTKKTPPVEHNLAYSDIKTARVTLQF
ncbi:MAG: ribosome maturation factor RimP [bacterium P3]|nr:MAG: ribosome maturation factor RimP [bacterium P3]KWW40762.1 MAG: ribosome maturation factor RimP [bacterium F083]